MDLTKIAAMLTGDKYVPFYGVDNNFFKLGDQVYEVQEDENDGYRSALGAILVTDKGTYRHNFFSKPVVEVKAEPSDRRAHDKDQIYGSDNDLIRLVDRDGHVWLEFGTINCLDYYPSFNFEYVPKP
jgi:hypothetical protein